MILVLGIGNNFRSDDALGILVVREFARRHLDGVAAVECNGDALRMLDLWAAYDTVVLVDAIRSGEEAGFVHLYDVNKDGLPAGLRQASTHAFGLVDSLALGRELKRLPSRVYLAGIEAGETGEGVGLSDRVVRSMPVLIHRIEEILHHAKSVPSTPDPTKNSPLTPSLQLQ